MILTIVHLRSSNTGVWEAQIRGIGSLGRLTWSCFLRLSHSLPLQYFIRQYRKLESRILVRLHSRMCLKSGLLSLRLLEQSTWSMSMMISSLGQDTLASSMYPALIEKIMVFVGQLYTNRQLLYPVFAIRSLETNTHFPLEKNISSVYMPTLNKISPKK